MGIRSVHKPTQRLLVDNKGLALLMVEKRMVKLEVNGTGSSDTSLSRNNIPFYKKSKFLDIQNPKLPTVTTTTTTTTGRPLGQPINITTSNNTRCAADDATAGAIIIVARNLVRMPLRGSETIKTIPTHIDHI